MWLIRDKKPLKITFTRGQFFPGPEGKKEGIGMVQAYVCRTAPEPLISYRVLFTVLTFHVSTIIMSSVPLFIDTFSGVPGASFFRFRSGCCCGCGYQTGGGAKGYAGTALRYGSSTNLTAGHRQRRGSPDTTTRPGRSAAGDLHRGPARRPGAGAGAGSLHSAKQSGIHSGREGLCTYNQIPVVPAR